MIKERRDFVKLFITTAKRLFTFLLFTNSRNLEQKILHLEAENFHDFVQRLPLEEHDFQGIFLMK